jgi:hypothetical protein
MDSKLEQSSTPEEAPGPEDAGAPETGAINTSRRQFSRQAVLGSAVVLSLANRPAWAGWDTNCVSTGFLTSYANNNRVMSHHPTSDEGGESADDKYQRLNGKINDWKGLVANDTDNTYRWKNNYAPGDHADKVCIQIKQDN